MQVHLAGMSIRGGAPSLVPTRSYKNRNFTSERRGKRWIVLSARGLNRVVAMKVTETVQKIVEGNLERPSRAPLLDALHDCATQDAAAFHFPGHRRGHAAPPLLVDAVGHAVFAHDLPELPELDNLFAPESVIAEAQRKAATLFGADATYFLVNGTTCGIQAAVMATCRPGDFLILPRNCHLSAVSAMVLSGSLPWYVMPTYDAKWGLAHGVDAHSIDAAMSDVRARGGKVGAVLIVSPTYFGVSSPIAEIAALCHRSDVPLIVDEAHGAHYRFHKELPQTALSQGANIAVQSTHKVLGSLTQSSMLHVMRGGRVDLDGLMRCLQLVQSSSPSYLLLSSLDAACAQMTSNGDDTVSNNAQIAAAIDLAELARKRLKQVPSLVVMDEDTMQGGDAIHGLDVLRITVGLWELGVDGFVADDVLRLEFGVIAELPTIQSITFAISCGTNQRDIDRLVQGLGMVSARFSKGSGGATHLDQGFPTSLQVGHGGNDFWNPSESCHSMSPRDAFFCKTRRVDATRAEGLISAELLCPYPPGIPVIAPGEVISDAALSYLRAVLDRGGTISGASDPSLGSISVCQR